MARNRVDPIKERARLKRDEANKLYLLKDVALEAFESRKAELKGDGQAVRWYSPVELHVLPKLRKVQVVELGQKGNRAKRDFVVLRRVRQGKWVGR